MSGVSRQTCEVAIQKYSLAYCSEKNTHRISHLEERRERLERKKLAPLPAHSHSHRCPRAPAEAREAWRKEAASGGVYRSETSVFQIPEAPKLTWGHTGGSTFCGRWSPVRGKKKEKGRLITAEVPGSRQGERRPDPKMRARPRWYLKQQQITGATASTCTLTRCPFFSTEKAKRSLEEAAEIGGTGFCEQCGGSGCYGRRKKKNKSTSWMEASMNLGR